MDDFLEIQPDTKQYLRDCFCSRGDDDGCLKLEELEESLQIVGLSPTKEHMDFLYDYFDKDKTGKVKIEALIDEVNVITVHSVMPRDFKKAFETCDLDGDGFVRLRELLEVLTMNDGMPVDDARKLLSYLVEKFDANHDGKFDYQEFVKICMAKLYPLHKWRPQGSEHQMQQTKK